MIHSTKNHYGVEIDNDNQGCDFVFRRIGQQHEPWQQLGPLYRVTKELRLVVPPDYVAIAQQAANQVSVSGVSIVVDGF